MSSSKGAPTQSHTLKTGDKKEPTLPKDGNGKPPESKQADRGVERQAERDRRHEEQKYAYHAR